LPVSQGIFPQGEEEEVEATLEAVAGATLLRVVRQGFVAAAGDKALTFLLFVAAMFFVPPAATARVAESA
jgi:hypothetical protein